MVDWAQLYLFELIFMRMSGFLLFNPLLGRSNLPAMVKTGMALVLSILVFGTAGTGVPQPDSWRFAFCWSWESAWFWDS